MAEINNTMTAHSGEDMEQEEHFSIVCGSAKLVNHSENQYGNSSTNQELFFLNTQLYLSWSNTQRQSIIHQGQFLNQLPLLIIARNLKQSKSLSVEE